MTPLLKGTAFITGAASGIGKATAFALARNGIQRLAITDISQKALLATKEELQSKFPKLEILERQLDVCDTKAVDDSIVETVSKFGRLDIGCNIAGIGGDGKPTHEVYMRDWEKVVDVNLHGVFRCQRAQIREMSKQENLGIRYGRGAIINVASMYGLIAPPEIITASPYTASKHGVLGLTKSDANNYASKGIRINAICPGYVKTPLLLESQAKGYMDTEISKTPMQRMAETEEIGDAIAFLGSPMASFMSGASLVVDGGYTVC